MIVNWCNLDNRPLAASIWRSFISTFVYSTWILRHYCPRSVLPRTPYWTVCGQSFRSDQQHQGHPSIPRNYNTWSRRWSNHSGNDFNPTVNHQLFSFLHCYHSHTVLLHDLAPVSLYFWNWTERLKSTKSSIWDIFVNFWVKLNV